ncbi:MAG: tRNA (adenosine(37)-N6)-threonylcarbamoyltransferase complex transferase subunit TsaD [Anaerolineales bacterium]|nr:tRNA (adenosine(37)-N6)-threonylcarbamoyltransferase complex transferase subunit TsaD [Anaerolineales bacterium]
MTASFPSARILALETSCDETAAAIIENGRILHSSIVASQMEIHARYGGVFPEVASRQHVLSVMPVVEQALAQAHLTLNDIDAIAVTQGPGLAGSLVVGINTAKGLALGANKPLIGVNHLEGHLYSAWVYNAGEAAPPEPQFPLIALLVSGGHTEINLMTDHLTYQRLGSTQDDAAGEAFDKVARLLELPYPGGPAIQRAAEEGDSTRFNFPRSWMDGTYNFSFSGLKTSVLYETQELKKKGKNLPIPDLAASFQQAVIDVLFKKTIQAARAYGAKEILIAGGVSANRALRQTFKAQTEFPVHIPAFSLCTDNAAMIGSAAYFRWVKGQVSELSLDARPTWPLA